MLDLRILDRYFLYFLYDLILILSGCLEILQQLVSDLVVIFFGCFDVADVDGVLFEDVFFQAGHLAFVQLGFLEDEPVEDLPVQLQFMGGVVQAAACQGGLSGVLAVVRGGVQQISSFVVLLLLLQKVLPFFVLLLILDPQYPCLVSVVDLPAVVVLLEYFRHKLLKQDHLILQEVPLGLSFRDHLIEVSLLLAPQEAHNILINLLIILMKQPILLIPLMPIILDPILPLYMFLIELPEDQFDLPFDQMAIEVRTPISSILYFFISFLKQQDRKKNWRIMQTTKPRTRDRASQSWRRSKQKQIIRRKITRIDEQITRKIMQVSLEVQSQGPQGEASPSLVLLIIQTTIIRQHSHSFINYNLMRGILNLANQLPFTHSFKSTLRGLLPVKTVIGNLGNTFYPRLVQIHQNITEALVQNNHKYLKEAMVPQLQAELIAIKAAYKGLGCRLKLNEPRKKLITTKNMILPDTVFRTQNYYISVACKVYFGGQLDHNSPRIWPPNKKILRFGKYRYLVYDNQLSLRENLHLIFSHNLYEFIIKYQTSMYINVFPPDSKTSLRESTKVDSKFDEDIQQDMVETEVVMRSSSDRFDWIIIDINKIAQRKWGK